MHVLNKNKRNQVCKAHENSGEWCVCNTLFCASLCKMIFKQVERTRDSVSHRMTKINDDNDNQKKSAEMSLVVNKAIYFFLGGGTHYSWHEI